MKRFRSCVLRISIPLIAASSAVAFAFDGIVALGLLVGGGAGVAGFLMMARDFDVEKASANVVKSVFRRWLAIRLLVYAAALYIGYVMDEVQARGLLAAAAGLMAVRIAVTVVGVTGWDLKEPER